MTTTDSHPDAARDSQTHVYRIYINAPAQRVWDGLTTSELTTRYGYAGPVEIEAVPGSRFRHWFGEPRTDGAGVPENAITGEVLEADPPRRLVLTWQPFWVPEEPPVQLTYEIEDAADGGVRLTLTQTGTGSPVTMAQTAGDAPADQPGGGGWPWVLSALKSLLENGTEVIRSA